MKICLAVEKVYALHLPSPMLSLIYQVHEAISRSICLIARMGLYEYLDTTPNLFRTVNTVCWCLEISSLACTCKYVHACVLDTFVKSHYRKYLCMNSSNGVRRAVEIGALILRKENNVEKRNGLASFSRGSYSRVCAFLSDIPKWQQHWGRLCLPISIFVNNNYVEGHLPKIRGFLC